MDRESHQPLSCKFFDVVNDAIFVTDPESGCFLDVNVKACSSLGHSKEELLTMGVFDIEACIPDIPEWKDQVNELKTQGIVLFEGRHKRKNGTTFPVEVNVKYVSEKGREYIIAVARDITKRKAIEQDLRKSEETFRVVTSSLAEGIYVMNKQGHVIFMNPEAEHLLGWTLAELSGKNAHDIVHSRKADGSPLPLEECCNRKVMESGIPFASRDEVFVRKDGTVFPVAVISSPIIEKDKIVGTVTAFRDITEQKNMEKDREKLIFERGIAYQELEQRVIERTAQLETINRTLQDEISRHKKSQENLKELAQRFQLAAASGQLGIWDWYVPSDFMVWNDRMLELYGISGEDFPNSIQAWINSLHPADSAKAIGECEAALRGEKEFDTEFRVMHADGTVKVLKANAIVIRDADGKPVRMLGLNRDVTEVRKMTSELNKSNEQLRNLTAHLHSVREEERTRIAREIHDELGQALTAQKMELSWLRDKYGDHKAIYEKTGAMLDALNATIRSVKLICTELRPSILDDFGLIDAMQWQANEFQTKTRIECAVENLHKDIQVDKDRSTVLFRIFQETLTNVLKHARATKVTARLAKDNDNIVLEVTDNGKGITDKELSKHQSFGLLGMRERVHPWGGKVEITGYKNKGTTVKVTMPRVA
ncbi:MAG: PAS domain S-box protein [Nitrospirae bacterium]|nr:PAS domain S-box protein [Nitrospirota bacterium]